MGSSLQRVLAFRQHRGRQLSSSRVEAYHLGGLSGKRVSRSGLRRRWRSPNCSREPRGFNVREISAGAAMPSTLSTSRDDPEPRIGACQRRGFLPAAASHRIWHLVLERILPLVTLEHLSGASPSPSPPPPDVSSFAVHETRVGGELVRGGRQSAAQRHRPHTICHRETGDVHWLGNRGGTQVRHWLTPTPPLAILESILSFIVLCFLCYTSSLVTSRVVQSPFGAGLLLARRTSFTPACE